MLQLENVTFTYPGQEHPTLKDLSVQIEKGTFLAVVGSNGSGKTTMCKLFNGIIPHFFVGDIEGKVTVDGVNTLSSDVSALSEKVGYVYQDFENSIVRATVIEEVSFGPLNYGYDDFKERARKALQILKIEHLENEHIWQLSGGQKHLVSLASVLALNPDYIIVDEPVAQLDPFHAKQTYNMLKVLHEEYDKTIIVIEHHTEFIADYCEQVLLMKDGHVQWIKDTEDALTDIEALLDSNIHPPQVTQLANELEYDRGTKLPINIEQSKSYFMNYNYINIPFEEQDIYKVEEPTVKVENMTASYKDYNKNIKTVLNNINLEFYKDDKIAIVGNNGAGKTTLMKLISKLMKPTDGIIKVMGTDNKDRSSEEIANVVSYIYQNPEEMFIDDSIEKDVAYFLKSRNIGNYQDRVDMILKALNLDGIRSKDARLLSGGQQRRVSLAIGMGMTPKVIMLDEPTGSLDISSRRELLRLLEVLKEHIQTTIVATHDMQLVADWATRVIVLHKGEVILDSTPRELFSNKEVMAKANLVPPQIIGLCHALDISPISLNLDELKVRLDNHKLVVNGAVI